MTLQKPATKIHNLKRDMKWILHHGLALSYMINHVIHNDTADYDFNMCCESYWSNWYILITGLLSPSSLYIQRWKRKEAEPQAAEAWGKGGERRDTRNGVAVSGGLINRYSQIFHSLPHLLTLKPLYSNCEKSEISILDYSAPQVCGCYSSEWGGFMVLLKCFLLDPSTACLQTPSAGDLVLNGFSFYRLLFIEYWQLEV